MLSIVATETSVLTFISVPGISYRGDWTFLQLAIGYVFGRILVSSLLIPMFFKHGVTSIYEILEKRFNVIVQRIASLTFLFTRVLADAVRFAAIAIVIQSITSLSITLSILIVGLVTLIYTVLGGLKTVMHIDAFQFFIYILSAFICIVSLMMFIDMPFKEIMLQLNDLSKLKIIDLTGNIFTKPFMFVSAFLGGTMLSFASHGADYMMVQRVLATKDVTSAKKAMIGSGIFVLFQFSLFLLVGSLIYVASEGLIIDKDQEMTFVILNILPNGLKGIVIAGVLSAAMSTLSSSINALSSSSIKDWFPKLKSLKFSRYISVFWTAVLILTAIVFQNSDDALVIIGLKIASFTYGSLLSFFILSKFKEKFETSFVIIGYIFGILTVFYFIKFDVAWTFYILGSVVMNVLFVVTLHNTKKYNIFKYLAVLLIIISLLDIIISQENTVHDFPHTTIVGLNSQDNLFNKSVYLGYDVFKEKYNQFADIKNIGVVINHTSSIVSIDSSKNIITSNLSDTHLNIKRIFTPEHGLNNLYQAGEKVPGSNDYNIPIISLYGKNSQPEINDIKNLDAVIFDIQDIGSRYYTYVSTMTEVMNVCAKADVPFIVFDRPNPLGGIVSGPLLDVGFSSFVGMHPIPIRHGMTIGELAYMINHEGWLENSLKTRLYIIKMFGWNRDLLYHETGLQFIPPSPNIPDLDTAIMYSGMCLFEGTNISEGRGTDAPFMKIGAPWVDSEKLLKQLNRQYYEGVEFKLCTFTPQSIAGKSINPKYLSEKCYGIHFIIKDKKKIKPIEIAMFILESIAANHKDDFSFDKNNFIDKLYGSDILRNSINSKKNINEIIQEWNPFNNEKYLLY